MHSIQCAVCSVQCAVYSVQCTASSVQCAVRGVRCAVCSVQCAVCSMQYAVRCIVFDCTVPVVSAGGGGAAGETGPHHESSLSQTDPGQMETVWQVKSNLIGLIYFTSLLSELSGKKSLPYLSVCLSVCFYLSVCLCCCQAGGLASPHPQLSVQCLLDNSCHLCVRPPRLT